MLHLPYCQGSSPVFRVHVVTVGCLVLSVPFSRRASNARCICYRVNSLHHCAVVQRREYEVPQYSTDDDLCPKLAPFPSSTPVPAAPLLPCSPATSLPSFAKRSPASAVFPHIFPFQGSHRLPPRSQCMCCFSSTNTNTTQHSPPSTRRQHPTAVFAHTQTCDKVSVAPSTLTPTTPAHTSVRRYGKLPDSLIPAHATESQHRRQQPIPEPPLHH